MTMPNERTRAVIRAREFLTKLCSPYGGGYKRIPKDVREMARRVLRHFPHPGELGCAESFDESVVKEYYDALEFELAGRSGVKKEEEKGLSAEEVVAKKEARESTALFVDPPQGWKYGFPKIYTAKKDGPLNAWLIKNGYPEKMINEWGDAFCCRFWAAEPLAIKK